MKIISFLLGLIFISLTHLSAQSLPILFEDDFDDNKNQWLSQFNNGTIEFQNGYYIINKTSTTGGYAFYKSIFMNDKKDWLIETKIIQRSGIDNNGYGLIWGAKDANNSYMFIVSSNGQYQIGSYKKGKFSTLKAWTKSTVIKPMGQANQLKVVKKSDKWLFYINEQQVHEMNSLNLVGTMQGFQTNNNMKLEVDYLKIYQEPSPINHIDNYPSDLVKENLGNKINSKYTDLSPTISADGNTIYFSRKTHPNNIPPVEKSDIWFSKKGSNKEWQEAVNIGKPINNNDYNFVVSVSPDENTLLVGNLYKADGSPAGAGVSITNRTKEGWEVPKKLDIKNFYNRNQYSEYCLSPDGKALLLCIERDDTYGDKDIYVSFLQNDNSWSEPQNIGNTVNSFGTEVGPFLAADGITMYYSSSGLPGYGRNDIFVTRRLDDTWLNWSEPQNLGPSVNTAAWEAYYTVPATGDYAYLVSSENSLGAEDIFRLKIPESAKPQPVVMIYGKVLNAKTKAPLGANITYELLKNNKEAGIARSNPADGSYRIALPAGEVYGFLGKLEGFYPVSENIDTKTYKNYTEIERNLYLVPIEKNAIIRLNNLFFDFAKYDLRPDSENELKRLIGFLNANPNIKVEIGGHTDAVGDDANNLTLSENRAYAVVKYLEAAGVKPDRLTAKGYGESKPIASNNTDDGRQLNRRVEFKILNLE